MSKIEEIVEEIRQLSVLEVSDLVKQLEEEFDVQPMAVPTAAAGAGAQNGEDEAEEKSEYNIEVTDAGDKKIDVIKAVREFRQDLGLKDTKALIDEAPSVVAENMPTEEAKEAKEKLEEAGATVELR